MKFYGNGIVWDKDNNKTLCEFVKGKLETEDVNIIEKLKSMDYQYEPVQEIDKVEINEYHIQKRKDVRQLQKSNLIFV